MSPLPVEKNWNLCWYSLFNQVLVYFELFNEFRFFVQQICSGYILAEFCHSLPNFRANLSSLINIKHRCFESYTISFLQGMSINLERNAFKDEKSRIVSCDICQVWAILVASFLPSLVIRESQTGAGKYSLGLLWLSKMLNSSGAIHFILATCFPFSMDVVWK